MKLDQSKRDAEGKLKNSLFKEFFQDGTPACVGKYRHGEKVGLWKYYLRNGQLRAAGKFAHGKMAGPWKCIVRMAN
jgi:Uncharacterized protein conserved in bacteria